MFSVIGKNGHSKKTIPFPDGTVPEQIVLGMTLSELSLLSGRNRFNSVAPARIVGINDNGPIIEMYFRDCRLTLEREKQRGPLIVVKILTY